MVVVDSDVWIHYLHSPDSPTGSALQTLLDANQVVMVGVVLAEILQGARTEREYSTLLPRLDAVPYEETTKQSWAAVGQIAAQLRGSGRTIPLTDIAIAALAIEAGHELFSLDGHFARVPALRLYTPQQ